MRKAKNSRMVYAVALVLFIAGFGTLLMTGLKQNSIYFLNVSEALAMPVEDIRQIRLFGTVAKEGLAYDADSMGVQFLLEDSDDPSKRIPVQFRGVVPDLFEPGAEVILEGGYQAQAEYFHAKTLMTKCPSKYEAENRSG
ncbi:cytochrome c-type biogenesis protein CcmE [Desulfonatronum thiosulfatophilum]|uniref:Cytochrome c-type biogenesis protein CcmE n=1 Tax=Desulfonatronum thiosulfatophilum TaxID=617002 RepID=A0A1G6A977_9BACT|nr:cytochrome c maturation protein CcmE [Desulfonatronum thiosulfatophilum]SDB04952.1 cytochrome c-type biogenesis protein CcmE [Desulfonatronum thiosulfatophilum]